MKRAEKEPDDFGVHYEPIKENNPHVLSFLIKPNRTLKNPKNPSSVSTKQTQSANPKSQILVTHPSSYVKR